MRPLALLTGLTAFLLVSVGLARVLSANGAERAAIADALGAQARGDARALRALAGSCATGCDELARRLRRRGEVDLLRLDPTSRFALGGLEDTTRVAWRAGRGLPVVQCLRLRRTGDVVRGIEVAVIHVSPPVDARGSCAGIRPRRSNNAP